MPRHQSSSGNSEWLHPLNHLQHLNQQRRPNDLPAERSSDNSGKIGQALHGGG